MRQADVVVQTYQGGKDALLPHLSTPLGADGAVVWRYLIPFNAGHLGQTGKGILGLCLGIMGPSFLQAPRIAMLTSEQIRNVGCASLGQAILNFFRNGSPA